MKRRITLGLIALALGGLAAITAPDAWAHGPTRQKITETVEVKASPGEVWAVIGNFGDMNWHPAVARTDSDGGNAIDATRLLTLKGPDGKASDATIAEVLYKYSAEKMSYSYRITAVPVEVLPVTNYSSHLTVKPGANGGSIIEWRGAFYRGYPNNDPPPELNDQAAVKAVQGVYRLGLDALAKRFN